MPTLRRQKVVWCWRRYYKWWALRIWHLFEEWVFYQFQVPAYTVHQQSIQIGNLWTSVYHWEGVNFNNSLQAPVTFWKNKQQQKRVSGYKNWNTESNLVNRQWHTHQPDNDRLVSKWAVWMWTGRPKDVLWLSPI